MLSAIIDSLGYIRRIVRKLEEKYTEAEIWQTRG